MPGLRLKSSHRRWWLPGTGVGAIPCSSETQAGKGGQQGAEAGNSPGCFWEQRDGRKRGVGGACSGSAPPPGLAPLASHPALTHPWGKLLHLCSLISGDNGNGSFAGPAWKGTCTALAWSRAVCPNRVPRPRLSARSARHTAPDCALPAFPSPAAGGAAWLLGRDNPQVGPASSLLGIYRWCRGTGQ